MAPPTAPTLGWPSTHLDPKWVFPWLDLAISPPRLEGEKEEDNVVVVTDGWAHSKPFYLPTFGWGSDDKHPPSLATAALVA